MSKTTRILLVEKSAEFRTSLAGLLGKQLGMQVIGQAKTTKQAISLTVELKPDLVLLDINLPGTGLSDICTSLRAENQKLKIIVMTEEESEDEVFAALASGSDGYCRKVLQKKLIIAGIQTVVTGDFWLDPSIAKKVIKTVDQKVSRYQAAGNRNSNPSDGDDEDLSSREIEVLDLVATGLSNVQIAEKLEISAETVKTHIRHIMRKLVVKDRTQAAVKALRQGLI
jgi:DNA-binding NarL/FixJ family response regulator